MFFMSLSIGFWTVLNGIVLNFIKEMSPRVAILNVHPFGVGNKYGRIANQNKGWLKIPGYIQQICWCYATEWCCTLLISVYWIANQCPKYKSLCRLLVHYTEVVTIFCETHQSLTRLYIVNGRHGNMVNTSTVPSGCIGFPCGSLMV